MSIVKIIKYNPSIEGDIEEDIMFSGLANTIHNHSKAIVLAWIIVLVASLYFVPQSGDVLIYDMTEMSGSTTESSQGSQIMSEYFTNSLDLSDIVVITYDNETELASAMAIYPAFATLVNEKYRDTLTVSSYGNYSKNNDGTGIYLLAIANNDSSFNINDATGDLRGLLAEAKNSVGAQNDIYLTGSAAIGYDTEKSSMEDVSKVDPLSIALIFILLGLFFYALVTALVPPVVVGMAYAIVLMLMYFIGTVLDIFYITQVIMLVAMLGAGCDYALFIITRYKDERRKGLSHDDALKEAVVWGGEAVFTSGISVIIGFAALALCDFSMVQTMGIILALGIAMTLFAALTFIPALLHIIGDKVFWPSNIQKYQENDVRSRSDKKGFHGHLTSFSRRYFGWLAAFTEKRAKAIAVVLVLVAVPSIYAYTQTDDSADMISVMPDSESVDGLNAIMEQTDGGMIMPTYVVLDLQQSIGTVGSIEVLGQTVPYIVWNEAGLNIDTTTGAITGAVPAMMGLSNTISAKHSDIVGTVSGTNSWQVIYAQAAQLVPGAGPKIINPVILNMMPAAVQQPITMILAAASGQDPSNPDLTNLTADPNSPVYVTPDYKVITVANVIDGILNYGTGIIDGTASHVAMMVITSQEPMSEDTMAFINELKEEFHGENGYDTVYSMVWSASYITGSAASMNDISKIVDEQFSKIRIVVAILLIILLFVVLGSYLTPIRAILTIILSVIITVAITDIVFNQILDTPVLFLVPIVLFVLLLGLGMDYEIFLTTKIRENKSKGMDNHKAISEAIRETGPVISLCALIMGGTFLTLVLAGSSMLKEFGFALGFGILIDGLLMVGFVSPALMHIMGDWSWKGPGFLTRRHGMNPDGTSIDAASEKTEE